MEKRFFKVRVWPNSNLKEFEEEESAKENKKQSERKTRWIWRTEGEAMGTI
jgi:hypothetical protein